MPEMALAMALKGFLRAVLTLPFFFLAFCASAGALSVEPVVPVPAVPVPAAPIAPEVGVPALLHGQMPVSSSSSSSLLLCSKGLASSDVLSSTVCTAERRSLDAQQATPSPGHASCWRPVLYLQGILCTHVSLSLCLCPLLPPTHSKVAHLKYVMQPHLGVMVSSDGVSPSSSSSSSSSPSSAWCSGARSLLGVGGARPATPEPAAGLWSSYAVSIRALPGLPSASEVTCSSL